MKKVEGLHILGTLTLEVDYVHRDLDFYRKEISRIIAGAGLTEVGNYYYPFDGGGFTGVVALCESHVSIHTWPEEHFVTLDVFTCNYSRDNKPATHTVFDQISALFNPIAIDKKEIDR
ncbi:MAG: S-adenosylmethionine decarboxylase [Patescibacteria group bacterium]